MSDLIDKSLPQTIRASATLTGTLVASDVVRCENDSHVTVEVDFTKGTGGTGLELVAETLREGASTWQPATVQNAGTPSAGAVAIELLSVTHTMSVTGVRSITFPVLGAVQFRVRAREVGSPSPFGTLALVAVRARIGG